MICPSCNNEHDENFCPACGQKNGIKKNTVTSILEDSFFSFTEIDKGSLFNLKSLLLKPQEITNDYIRGKRKDVFQMVHE